MEEAIWHTLCQAVGTAILGRCIAICHAKNDLSEDRCRRCGVSLLKKHFYNRTENAYEKNETAR